MGVNEEMYDFVKYYVILNVFCIINCLVLVIKVIDKYFKVKRGFMIIVYLYINDQQILDFLYKDLRRVRVVVFFIILIIIGVVKVVVFVFLYFKGKFNGFVFRVLILIVFVIDVVFEVEKLIIKEEVNSVLKVVVEGELKGILGYSEELFVFVDYKGDLRFLIVDVFLIMVIEDIFVKVVVWYDNEWGYFNRVVDFLNYIVNKGL